MLPEKPVFETFYNAIKSRDIKSVNNPTKQLYQTQFDFFMSKLDSIITEENLCDADIESLGPQYFITKFINTKINEPLYVGCEEIIYCIVVAGVKHSCESVLESFVSRYENHFDQNRNLDKEQAINEEFSIAVNGPNIAQCDSTYCKRSNEQLLES